MPDPQQKKQLQGFCWSFLQYLCLPKLAVPCKTSNSISGRWPKLSLDIEDFCSYCLHYNPYSCYIKTGLEKELEVARQKDSELPSASWEIRAERERRGICPSQPAVC